MTVPVYVPASRTSNYDPFVNRARQTVQCVVNVERPSRKYIGYVPVSYYNWSNPFCFMPVVTPVYVGPREPANNETGRAILGIAAAAIGGVGIFYLGQSIQQLTTVKRELDDIRDFENFAYKDTTLSIEDKNYYMRIAECKKAIFTRIRGNAIANLILTIGIVVAAAFALIGAIINLPALMITGAVLGAVAGGAIILKWGINYGDDVELRQAKSLETALNG